MLTGSTYLGFKVKVTARRNGANICQFMNNSADTVISAQVSSTYLGCPVSKLCTTFERNRIICSRVIDNLAHFRPPVLGGGALFSGMHGPTSSSLARTQGDDSWQLHYGLFQSRDILLHFQMWVAQS